eukprot:13332310-Alexandrium_andersonii.AAC.1
MASPAPDVGDASPEREVSPGGTERKRWKAEESEDEVGAADFSRAVQRPAHWPQRSVQPPAPG